MFSCDSRVLDILQTLHTAGFQAYLVGGCVRDALLGTVPHDYDCATSALPDEILSVCSPRKAASTRSFFVIAAIAIILRPCPQNAAHAL